MIHTHVQTRLGTRMPQSIPMPLRLPWFQAGSLCCPGAKEVGVNEPARIQTHSFELCFAEGSN